MNARVSARGRTKAGEILKVVGLAAALLVGSSAGLAEHGGGGGGGGGGGSHMSVAAVTSPEVAAAGPISPVVVTSARRGVGHGHGLSSSRQGVSCRRRHSG